MVAVSNETQGWTALVTPWLFVLLLNYGSRGTAGQLSHAGSTPGQQGGWAVLLCWAGALLATLATWCYLPSRLRRALVQAGRCHEVNLV